MKISKRTLVLLGILVVLFYVSKETRNDQTDQTNENSPTKQPIFEIGQSIKVGYTTYQVINYRWANDLPNGGLPSEKPNAKFLIIRIAIQNNDKQPRTIPLMKLVDENGAEYETSNKSWQVKNSIGLLESLNPGVDKDGVVIFDAPQNHLYHLKVSGGYKSSAMALIKIAP